MPVTNPTVTICATEQVEAQITKAAGASQSGGQKYLASVNSTPLVDLIAPFGVHGSPIGPFDLLAGKKGKREDME